MKGKHKLFVARLLLPGLACLLAAGCSSLQEQTFTGQLWDSAAMVETYKPAANPNLKLFQRGNSQDVLVQYDEEREKTGATRRRAYFLMAYLERMERGKKPHFVSEDLAAGMEPIPIKMARESEGAMAVCAKLIPGKNGFVLLRDGKEEGEFYLPLYANKKAETARLLLLTPATLTMDTAVAGTVVGVLAAYAYAQGSYPGNR